MKEAIHQVTRVGLGNHPVKKYWPGEIKELIYSKKEPYHKLLNTNDPQRSNDYVNK